MKKLLVFGFVSVLIATLWITLILAKQPKQDTAVQCAKWIEQIMADCEAVKPGMTREELERNFTMDGGLSSGSHQRYVHRLSSGRIKLDIEFNDKPYNSIPFSKFWEKTDTVVKVSKPYLEHPIID